MNLQGAPDEVLTIAAARDASAGASFPMNEPVLGYRAWLIEPGRDGYRLRSVLWSAQWASTPGAWTVAACRPQTGSGSPLVRHNQTSAPNPDCTCGIYAYHSLSIGGYDGRLVQPDSAEIGIVWGAVVGTGRVLVYPDGWRAQFARPVAILQGSGSERHLRGLSNRLGIPTAPSWDIVRGAAEFGRPWRTLGDAQPRVVLDGRPREQERSMSTKRSLAEARRLR